MVLSVAAKAAIRVASKVAPKRRVVRRAVKKVKKIVEKSRVGKAVDSAVLYPFARERTKREVKKLRRWDIDTMGSIRKDRKLSAGETLRIQRMKMRIPGVIIGGSIDKTADKVERFGLKHDIKVLNPWKGVGEGPGKKHWLGTAAISGTSAYALYASKTGAEKKPNPKDKKGGKK